MEEDIQKSSGGYMSVDPAAAVQQNRPIIEQIRQTVQQAPQQRRPQSPTSGSQPHK